MSGELSTDISCEADAWGRLLPDAGRVVCRAADAAWAAAGETGDSELSILLTDDARMRVLNRDYRGKDKATNVLSFPAGDDEAADRPRLLGDIALALETVEREASEQSKTPADHVSHLTVHGVLHLLGHDHETEPQATDMEALEARILDGLGIANPYAAEEFSVG
jgi:probable rRNA maturation factor